MPTDRLRVVARVKAKEDRIEDVRNALTALVVPTRAEPGCVTYELLQNTQDPTDFTFVEEWSGEEAFAGHFETEHIKDVLPKLEQLAAEPPDIRSYSVVA